MDKFLVYLEKNFKYNQIKKIKSFGDRKDMNHDYA